jgi:hypothetical protein
MMASQKTAGRAVALHDLVTAAYGCTPRSSTLARLAAGDFCLATLDFDFVN